MMLLKDSYEFRNDSLDVNDVNAGLAYDNVRGRILVVITNDETVVGYYVR